MATFDRTTLSNGTRVLTAGMDHAQSVSCFLMYAAGSRYERREESGIAHFAEHMFFKGTERRPTARDIATEIDTIGGEFNAFTGKELTGYYVKCAAETRDVALDVLVDMRRVAPDTDGLPIAAVHLGHHHGFDGALVALSALLLSRPRLRRGTTARVTVAVTALALAYGIVNCVQDAWNEQLVKRGTLDWKIPDAILPSLSWIWLVILVLAALTALALRAESLSVDSPG